MSEPLPPEIAEALHQADGRFRGIGHPLHYFTEITSTNDIAGVLAERGADQGTTVIASAQTAGRGRLGRHWYSPHGAGLYFSVVFRSHRVASMLTGTSLPGASLARSATCIPSRAVS